MRADTEKPAAWTPTKVQFLYRHQNQRYYVRTFAGGKEKWTSLKTTLLSVARNRMKEHLDAAERQKSTGEAAPAMGKLTFGEVTEPTGSNSRRRMWGRTRKCTTPKPGRSSPRSPSLLQY